MEGLNTPRKPELLPELRAALQKSRERINTAFAFTRQSNPSLRPEVFGEKLVRWGNRLAETLPGENGTALQNGLLALSDVLLDLLGKGVAGEGGKFPEFDSAFDQFAFRFPGALAENPRRLLASLSNAWIRVKGVPGARSSEWLEGVVSLPPDADLASILDAGAVFAWKSGLSALRKDALSALKRLTPGLRSLAFPGTHPGGGEEWIQRLTEDPWADPATDDRSPRFRQAGGFTGFDGPFLRPPEVYRDAGGFLVFDGDELFRLHADRFGTMLIRARVEGDLSPMKAETIEGLGWKADEDSFTFRGGAVAIPRGFAEDFRTCAAEGNTFCWTSGRSHRVFIAGIPAD